MGQGSSDNRKTAVTLKLREAEGTRHWLDAMGTGRGAPIPSLCTSPGRRGWRATASPERGVAGRPALAVCTEQLWASSSSPGLREAVREEGIHIGWGARVL